MAAPARPKYVAHKFALIFPNIDAPTFNGLVKNMRENGWNDRYPVVMYGGLVLDGRNRLRAAEIAKVDPTFTEFSGTEDEALQFVVTANLHRRHLTASEKAVIAAELIEATRETKSAALRSSPSGRDSDGMYAPDGFQKNLAVVMGVSDRLIDQARELKQTDPRRFRALKESSKTMPPLSGEKRDRAPRTVGAALKQSKNEEARKQAKAATPPPETDDAGHPIHPRAMEALHDGRDRFASLIRQVHALKREALALAAGEFGRGIHRQTVETDFENITRQLRFAAPYSSCPMNDPCDEGCKLCRGTQWIGEGQYQGLPAKLKERKK